MITNLLVLPDGTELYSGADAADNVRSVSFKHCVNSEKEFTLGSVWSSIMEATLQTPCGKLNIETGTEVTAYKVLEDGTRHLVGLYTLEKPTRQSANTYKITAYDRVSWLDKDLAEWVNGLSVWPVSLLEFAKMVCAECGLVLTNESIPNGDYLIQQFSAGSVTGRTLMRWVGEACARFLRATADGAVELATFRENADYRIGSEKGNGVIAYFGGALSYEDYRVATIEKVQIRQTDDDVGVIYPGVEGEANTYIITGNHLLTATTTDDLLPVVQAVYEEIKGVTYTPCKVSIPATLGIQAGDIVRITDANGVSITTYVMTKTQKGQRDTLECTGSHRRDSSTAVNDESYKALNGKILEIRKEVSGLSIANKDNEGRLSKVELNVDGLNTEVTKQTQELDTIHTDMTEIKQTTQDVSIKVQKIVDDGASKVTTAMGYTFGDDGLHIAKQGEQIDNLVDHTGIHVMRDDEVMLQADHTGVNAADVKVRNYLIIGNHARFEDYTDGTDSERTACFWI